MLLPFRNAYPHGTEKKQQDKQQTSSPKKKIKTSLVFYVLMRLDKLFTLVVYHYFFEVAMSFC